MFPPAASSIEGPSEMEELLKGLKCSLRLSGKIGDSAMTGIIGASMEDANERILRSKDDGLECLNHKTRFCSLAIMLLDWCLWFLEEEMDDSCDDERLDLIGDLRFTRDRIRGRLEQTEIAIVEIENEMFGLRSLRAALDLEGSDGSVEIVDLKRSIIGQLDDL